MVIEKQIVGQEGLTKKTRVSRILARTVENLLVNQSDKAGVTFDLSYLTKADAHGRMLEH